MDAPMGPIPYWMTRIFFFTMASPEIFRNLYLKVSDARLQRLLPAQVWAPKKFHDVQPGS
jgi:hypothetical protein